MVDNKAGHLIGQLRRGVVDHCVLALLQQGEGYGFDLAKTLTHAQLIAGEGTIYPLLSRLRRDGLVDTRWRESDQGPPRRYYVLTESGQEVLENFRSQWERFKRSVDSVMALPKEDIHAE